MLKIRRPLGRLIFNMGIAIPGKTVFLIETAPWSQEKRRYIYVYAYHICVCIYIYVYVERGGGGGGEKENIEYGLYKPHQSLVTPYGVILNTDHFRWWLAYQAIIQTNADLLRIQWQPQNAVQEIDHKILSLEIMPFINVFWTIFYQHLTP